jgi:hypothetical protein
MEALEVEPVRCLRCSDQPRATTAQRQLLGQARRVVHARGRLRSHELAQAAVDRQHGLEVPRQRDRGLAIAGRAIDRKPPVRASDAM